MELLMRPEENVNYINPDLYRKKKSKKKKQSKRI